MTGRVVVLRPEPGASLTAARAKAYGLDPVVAPLFTVRPMAWSEPDPAQFDAVLLTSANGAHYGGRRFTALPCYAVGESTAAAAREAGYRDVRPGPSGGAAAAAMMAAAGVRRALHLCGRDHLDPSVPAISLERRLVYASDAHGVVDAAALRAIAEGAVVLLHSPRAARQFAALTPDREAVSVAAISPAVAAAAGDGWKRMAAAARPRDEALLELALQLCQTDEDEGGRVGG